MREQVQLRTAKDGHTILAQQLSTPHGLAPMICTALNLADFATPIVDFSLCVLLRYQPPNSTKYTRTFARFFLCRLSLRHNVNVPTFAYLWLNPKIPPTSLNNTTKVEQKRFTSFPFCSLHAYWSNTTSQNVIISPNPSRLLYLHSQFTKYLRSYPITPQTYARYPCQQFQYNLSLLFSQYVKGHKSIYALLSLATYSPHFTMFMLLNCTAVLSHRNGSDYNAEFTLSKNTLPRTTTKGTQYTLRAMIWKACARTAKMHPKK